MLTANQEQVGGTHYKTEYEHWDLAIFLDMGCLEYTTTKHVTRWRKKDGVKDLLKALHELEKLIEVYSIYNIHRTQKPEKITEEVDKFAKANGLDSVERRYILILCSYIGLEDLYEARRVLRILIEAANNRPGTPEDGGHHARQAAD
jgi:hypothetical protein